MATGIGISVRNAPISIGKQLLGKKSAFARTPKFNMRRQQGTFRIRRH